MTSVCFYFQVHQPHRLRRYNAFQIGNNSNYFDKNMDKEILERVAKKCYLPTNQILMDMISKDKTGLKVSYSFSGNVLEQLEMWAPEVIDSFNEIKKTGCAEFLTETYYHSLAYIYDKDEFRTQVEMQKKKLGSLFKCNPKVFRNTELIYSNKVARMVSEMGFIGILTEGTRKILGDRSPNFVYTPAAGEKLKILLNNYRMSGDIAFRFPNSINFPGEITAKKYAKQLRTIPGQSVNLFMDYEVFGEHKCAETGIFKFLRNLPPEIAKQKLEFATPSDVVKQCNPVAEIDSPQAVSWADKERDLSAWFGNKMQKAAIRRLFALKNKLELIDNPEIVRTWRELQTSDHFYYMATKCFKDNRIHDYFSHYESPYDAFINYMNVMEDFEMRLEKELRK